MSRSKIYLFLLLDQLEEITASAILKDDPQMIPCFVPVEELEDMPVFQIVKDADLKSLFLAISSEIKRNPLHQSKKWGAYFVKDLLSSALLN
jgi:hypothetical protein